MRSKAQSEAQGEDRNLAHYDVVIIGAGLAGNSLARQLLLETTGKTILLLDRWEEPPAKRQKVGESQVQVAGFYYGRVLDMEQHLFLKHFLKYNLRFYWPSTNRDNRRFEDLGKSYIQRFSNIPTYQVDRNVLEAEILRRNREDERFSFQGGVRVKGSTLSEDGGPHLVHFEPRLGEGPERTVSATWVIDASGRGKVLARQLESQRKNPIRHGSFFWWVDGMLDVDRLTDQPVSETRKRPERRHVGHIPAWLATNHFCGEGFWFWVIPLQGITSLGLVYDRNLVDEKEVFSVEKATKFVLDRFPCFQHDLPHRKVVDFGGLKDYSFDCTQTIHPTRWAMAGEAGRFTDPLYSPGSDLIAIYNTLIVDAIKTDDQNILEAKCRLYEQLMKAVYSAYVPSYAISYDTLGDQEVFSLKYVWELAIYFGFYVFPFINDLFTDHRFGLAFLRSFSRLGPINEGMQRMLSGYYWWRKGNRMPPAEPRYLDFLEVGPLARSEKTFYELGVSVEEAKTVLAEQLQSLEEFARYLAAHVASQVLEDERIAGSRAFVAGIDVNRLGFDPEAWRARWQTCAADPARQEWTFCPKVFNRFRDEQAMMMDEAHEAMAMGVGA